MGRLFDYGEQQPDAGDRDDEARADQSPLRVPLGESLRGNGGDEDAGGCRGEDEAGLDRAEPALGLQEH